LPFPIGECAERSSWLEIMMRAVDELEVSFPELDQLKLEAWAAPFDRLNRRKLLIMIIAVIVGLGARVYRLDAAGFAEDEANKVFAIRAYEQGDFTANAEHPMVMKLLCYCTLHAAAAWNRSAGSALHLEASDEAAFRLPNAVVGALTVIPLFLLTTALLGFRVGVITSALWALGLDAIWFNRIAKEDTLLVFFEFLGFYLYYRAKHLPASDETAQERLYALAGAAFGLMVASKYFPHYLGLNALYYTIVGYDSRNNRPLTRTMWLKFFGGMLLAFTIINPAVFFPQTWRYLWKYVNEELLTHHGYLVMDNLYVNDFLQTPGGTPWYFYPLFILVKLPLPVLVAFGVGLVEVLRRRGGHPHARGYSFLKFMLFCWFLAELLVGVKFLRYTLTLLPLLYMASAVGIVVMWDVIAVCLRKIATRQVARATAATAVIAAFVFAPSALTIKSLLRSHPSLYVNVFGRGRVGYFFPHDEFYDLGARESIRFVAETAPHGSTLASEIPGVVQYYLERFYRPDIRSRIISQPSFSLSQGAPDFVLLQRGRVYFENLENFEFIEKNFPAVHSSVYEGARAATVYSTGNALR
jgi:hypothetical protein